MNFALGPEQLLIKDSVARFAAGEHAGRDHWSTFAELGWLALAPRRSAAVSADRSKRCCSWNNSAEDSS